MKRWEYVTLKMQAEGALGGGHINDAWLRQALNQMGDEGWELVGFVKAERGHGMTHDIVAVMKREKPASTG